MKQLETEFVKNIGKTGEQTFKQLKSGKTPGGKPIYIYSRTYNDGHFKGKTFSFETIIASVKPAGDVTFPGGVVVHHDEDYEEYATTSMFGTTGWEHKTFESAEKKFNELLTTERTKGRKAVQVDIKLPEGEFIVKDVIELNKVAYPIASKFVKDSVEKKTVEFLRSENRGKGKPTNVYKTT